MFDPHRAWLHHLQRFDIDFLKVCRRPTLSCGLSGAGHCRLDRRSAHHQLPEVALGSALDSRRAREWQEQFLGMEKLLDAATQHRPILLLDRKIPPQIQ